MSVIFVIGPAGAGKSTFIKEKFPNYKVIDLYDFQKNINPSINNIWTSYMDCRDALMKAVSENDNVILEHTLLKRERRKLYIDAVKSVKDVPIDVYAIIPTIDKLIERRKNKFLFVSKENIKEELEMFDIPKEGDGFNKIEIIRN